MNGRVADKAGLVLIPEELSPVYVEVATGKTVYDHQNWSVAETGTDCRLRRQVEIPHRGFALALIGLMVVMVGWILTLVGGNIDVESGGGAVDRAETLAYSFGATVLGFGTIKLAIGVILTGIIIRLWMRVDAVKTSLPKLKAEGGGEIHTGTGVTPYGTADVTTTTPKSLPIHRMAKTMWAPMLAMGYMILIVGFIISLVWARSVDNISLGAGPGARCSSARDSSLPESRSNWARSWRRCVKVAARYRSPWVLA